MPARNNGAKIIICTSFATSCLAVLQIIILASPTTKVDAKTCIEVEENNFICSDEKNELAEARKRARKNVQYYLNNFGARQTIDGNPEENEQMLKVANDMEDYLKSWISRYDNVEEMKEKCTNQHDKCVYWASVGECKNNPSYMQNDCMLACKTCTKLITSENTEL